MCFKCSGPFISNSCPECLSGTINHLCRIAEMIKFPNYEQREREKRYSAQLKITAEDPRFNPPIKKATIPATRIPTKPRYVCCL